MKKLGCALIGCMTLSGCYSPLVMNSVNPKPNVIMNESKQALALEIDEKIEDVIVFKHGSATPINLGIDVTINEWKNSLRSGFSNAFNDYYKIVSDPKQADLILRIQRADLELVPAAVIVGGKTFTPGTVASIKTQITYKAKLTDAQGNAVKQSSNSALSKSVCPKFPGVKPGIKEVLPDNVKDAVESMYELIVQDMFRK